MFPENRSWVGDKRRNAGSGLQNESTTAGGERDSEEEKVRSEVFAYQENSDLPEKNMRTGVRKLLRRSLVLARVRVAKQWASRSLKGQS